MAGDAFRRFAIIVLILTACTESGAVDAKCADIGALEGQAELATEGPTVWPVSLATGPDAVLTARERTPGVYAAKLLILVQASPEVTAVEIAATAPGTADFEPAQDRSDEYLQTLENNPDTHIVDLPSEIVVTSAGRYQLSVDIGSRVVGPFCVEIAHSQT